MDLSLVALFAAAVAAIVLSMRFRLWAPIWQPKYAYQRVFTSGAAGLLFLVSGGIGWRISRHEAFVAGTRWTDGPIWWQVGIGLALLTLAAFWAVRVPPRPTLSRQSSSR